MMRSKIKEMLNNIIVNQINRAHHFKDNEGMDKLIAELLEK